MTRIMSKFQNPKAELARQPAPSDLKIERADWTLFRTVEGLQQKGGVALDDLAALVLKELGDNALDAGGEVTVGELPKGGYYIQDDGAGIDGTPEEIARLFSIERPLISTKLLRLPTRGALGNGLRVVAGAVLASGGSLVVMTRNRRIVLRPERDGTTTVVSAKATKFPIGTRIEISFGAALPCQDALSWARMACFMHRGSSYTGKSSAWWYDVPQFHELLSASGARPVRDLIANLDGCSGGKAGEIVAAAKLGRALCSDVTRPQAEKLLLAISERTLPVSSKRLGAVGSDAYPGHGYASVHGVVEFGIGEPQAHIPFVIESWAHKLRVHDNCSDLTVYVNRTPVTGNIEAARDNREIDAFGCGLQNTIARAPKDVHFDIRVNITTPYMPITSDGKEPNLEPFLNWIVEAVGKAVKKAQRPTSSTGAKPTQKDVVLDHLQAVIDNVSGGGEYRFNYRQLLYALRPIVRNELGSELKLPNFTDIITDYEAERGEIEGAYREPRGSIYHPHRAETITLGTLMVEEYERPAWCFNKVVYIEKEGFSEALKEQRWAERHDCMLMSSKGFSSRAARDLVDQLAEHDEPVTIFCVHDADAAGTTIYQTFQEATKARGARKIKIVNLGLEPWEAIDMGLEVEIVPIGKKRKPVAEYVRERDDDGEWDEWLQTHYVELNAMTTPRFIEWLDGKMADYAKLIPPADVLTAELEQQTEHRIRDEIRERILHEVGYEDQVAAAIAGTGKPNAEALVAGIKGLFAVAPESDWRKHITDVVADLKIAGGE